MSKPRTFEMSLLESAESILSTFSTVYDQRLLAIEYCASLFGGFRIEDYWSRFNIIYPGTEEAKRAGALLFQEICKTRMSPAIAIASLSREPLADLDKKKHGVFYTDFRLSDFISQLCNGVLKKDSKIADISSGTGVLLAGVADLFFRLFETDYDEWISKCVFAFDLSNNALRGARAAIAVHTSSINALDDMCSNWCVCDSLLTNEINDNFFDIIVGNPPWGKVKLSLHSFVNSSGLNHVYGSTYDEYDEQQFAKDKNRAIQYSQLLKKKYSLLEKTEPDMYMAFLQKALSSLKPNGRLVYIVPAGIIRSKGTQQIRQYFINNSSSLHYYLFDNKARFFEIDTRFKFVIISSGKRSNNERPCKELFLSICTAKNEHINITDSISFDIDTLKSVRSDLTVPECRSEKEKNLFFKICKSGMNWYEEWSPRIIREVDMTNSRKDFDHICAKDFIPVIEGRMIQQFRFGSKAYVSGSGRSALWAPTANTIKPQFYIRKSILNQSLQNRIQSFRIGYCDIAGQTNERAMMSAIVPPNVVCGNKVPTILFPNNNTDYMYLWIGIANSFVFDWFLRRIISTTINYFLLISVPFPKISIKDNIANDIILRAKELSKMQSDYYSDKKMGVLRAEIDVLVAQAYGLSFSEIELVMQDFPLLDRGQKPINKEKSSTITRDLVLSLAEKAYGNSSKYYSARYEQEKTLDIYPYIPAEMRVLCKTEEKDGFN